MRREEVVLGFIKYKSRILLMRRNSGDFYPSKWNTVVGFLEDDRTPYKNILREIAEETQISEKNLKLLREGKVVFVPDEEIGIEWKVHPYLFESKTNEVRLNEENVEYKWINPEELKEFDTIPMLKKIYEDLSLTDEKV
jgi:ADP-ribose pyrophosphatase YjhB (NUDIX family)